MSWELHVDGGRLVWSSLSEWQGAVLAADRAFTKWHGTVILSKEA